MTALHDTWLYMILNNLLLNSLLKFHHHITASHTQIHMMQIHSKEKSLQPFSEFKPFPKNICLKLMPLNVLSHFTKGFCAQYGHKAKSTSSYVQASGFVQWLWDNPLCVCLRFCASVSSGPSSSSSSLLSSPFICKERNKFIYSFILSCHFPNTCISGHTYFSKHEFVNHAHDERRPEHVQQQQDHQQAVQEIISKKWLKLFQRINARTVDQPATRPTLAHSTKFTFILI